MHISLVSVGSLTPLSTAFGLSASGEVKMSGAMLGVFDLDFTVWRPEMYQLYGKPEFAQPPKGTSARTLREAKTRKEGLVLRDRDGSVMRVFHGA